MKNPIKILLKEEGSSKASIMYTGLYHNDKPGHEYIQILTDIVKEQAGIPTTFDAQKPMQIDNTTPVPVEDEEGNPVMREEQQIAGYEKMMSTFVDENGDIYQEEQDDYSKPIYKTVQIQKTIGEYDKTIWEHFDSRNPAPKNISESIYDGIVRKVFEAPIPFVFVQTQAYLIAHP